MANHWQLNYAQIEESHTQDIKHLWQKTPSLWTCPQFDWGKVTPQALTELASELVSRREFVCDTVAERFLAVANKIAYNDPQSARTSLAGVKPTSVDVLLNLIACWVKGIEPEGYWGADQKDMVNEVLHARNYVVCKNLDQLPCILSTPSKNDLSITVDDVCKRLEKYQKNNIGALEADIFLALTRLDTKTQSSKNLNLLKTLKVDVILQSGKKMPVNAGDIVLAYLDCPVKEVLLDYNEEYFGDIKIPTTPSLQYFPKRFDSLGDLTTSAFSVFPLWGDAAIRLSVSSFNEMEHGKGLIFRQIAKRQMPLTAGVAMNILAAQRSASPRAIADIALAVNEAWERGLLIPGIADVFLLDWINSTPSKLVSLVATLSNIAQQGLLSVVWPILDELILASLKAPRLLVGTDEIVNAIAEFLPEVQFAVTNGLASPNQLDLLGLRALAEKTGSSRAISVAKYIITQLPDIKSVKSKKSNEVNITDFDKIWPKKERNIPVLDDGAIISIDLFEQSKSNSAFIFTLKLPDINDRVFHIVKTNWFYDLEEGQCQAYPAPIEHPKFTTDSQKSVYLHWDNDKKALLVSKYRNWLKNEDGPLSSTKIPALSNTLLMVVIGLLAQDGEGAYFAENYVLTSRIDEETVRRAILLFLKNPIVSPAKLIRSLEKEIKFLPLLWPILIECVRFVGNLVSRGEKIPVWTNRILDISLQYAA